MVKFHKLMEVYPSQAEGMSVAKRVMFDFECYFKMERKSNQPIFVSTICFESGVCREIKRWTDQRCNEKTSLYFLVRRCND